MAETPAGVADLLRRSLVHLAEQVPASHRHLVAELGSLQIEVTSVDVGADPATFTVRGDGPRIVVADGPAAAPGTRIATSRATILDIIDAEVGLADAVESGRLHVHGPLDDVVHALDALLAYVHAAVRAPAAPGLLAALRAGAGERR